MKEYIPHKEPIPYLIVKNYFDEKDVELMLQETDLVRTTDIMSFEDGIGMPDGHKKNEQITVDSIYQNRNASHILTKFDKIYKDEKLISTLQNMSWFYDCWGFTNRDSTFINYSEKGDYYKEHRDIAVITMMYWIWKKPKSFTGGDLLLPRYNIKIPIKRNQLMIIPSSIEHEILPITKGFGRWGIIRFLYLIPPAMIRVINPAQFNEEYGKEKTEVDSQKKT
tara:strand:+ start:232 stop:900 length:669 start_codon:yes stop_codon:yes gene_type:complete